jgi:sugar phosphate isomerase/epimerase
MKLSVSAIAWNATEESRALALLHERGVRCVEHVPARSEAVAGEARALELEIVAFQALLFGTSGLHLFHGDAERAALEAHLSEVCALAERLGARALIFGSPKNRFIDPSLLDRERAFAIAREFFGRAGRVAAERGCWICLEPNPAEYGCNFLTTTAETAAFVRSVDSPGIRLNLDAGALAMNDESAREVLEAHLPILGHVHVSEPRLAPVGAVADTRSRHELLARELQRAGYRGVLSIEMLRPGDDWEKGVSEAIGFVRETYGAA